MRRVLVLGMSLLALAACQKKTEEAAKTGDAAPAAAAAPPAPIGPPKRKPGLWAQTMNTAGMKQVVKLCLDADTEAKMSVWGQDMSKSMCSKSVITPVQGGMQFASECDMGEMGHVSSTGTAIGDFNSSYTVKISSTTTGSKMAQANGHHEMTMDATYQGACPAGMKGGDMKMKVPGMAEEMTINVEQAAATKK